MSQLALIPHMSEKALALSETGVYVFEVPAGANKIEVAKAVSETFKVTVTDVNVLVHKGKQVSRRYGKKAGRRSDLKKAMVKVKKGQSIKLFEEGSK